MRIRDLHINDFGIIQSQSVTGLGEDVNIIGGPNRAGKTTFMQVLRYLGYKFPRTDIIPSPKYTRIRATLILENGQETVLERDGFAEPVLKSSDKFNLEDIYPVDEFTYRQLFTISLDELNRLPAGVEKKETKRLQSVLLGAGLADAANLTDVLSEFRKNANDIGGVNGNPSVKEFKDANQDINEAIEKREAALRQVDEYREKQTTKQEIEDDLISLEKDKTELEKRRDRLEYLNQYYVTFYEYSELEDSLKQDENIILLEDFPDENIPKAERLLESYSSIVEEYENLLGEFRQLVPDENWRDVKTALLENQSEIREWSQQLSGLQERLKSLEEDRERHDEQRRTIIVEMQQINSDWGDDFSAIQSFDTDFVTRAHLREEISEYKDVTQKKESIEAAIEDLREEISTFEQEMEQLEVSESADSNRYYWASGFLMVVGILLGALVVPWLGIIVAVGGALATVITYLSQTTQSTGQQQANQLRSEKRMRKSKLVSREAELEEVKAEWESLSTKITEYKNQLGLGQDVHPDTVREFYDDIADLKKRIAKGEQTGKAIEQSRKSITENLRTLHGIVAEIFPDFAEKDPTIKNAVSDIQKLRTAAEWLEFAQKLDSAQSRKLETEVQIFSLLSSEKSQMSLEDSLAPDETKQQLEEFLEQGRKYQELKEKRSKADSLRYSMEKGFTDRIRAAFEYSADESLPESFDEFLQYLEVSFEAYLSEEEIQEKMKETSEEINQIAGKISDMQSELERVKVDLDNLATTDKLEEAQEQIDKARSRLEPLAREYAVNRIAEAILEEVQERFMHRTRDELLSKASSYFQQMTSGDYEGISLPDNLENADFISLTDSGNAVDTTDYLSRGTQEQLFLSVRLSRIQEIQPPLPIILDDSLVNFDSAHRRQAVDIIEELSRTNQIFVLTCHPEIVEYVEASDAMIKYWTIEDGIISSSDYSGVVKHLQE
ncbi:MAG: Chromosome partition protein Smc [Candidatus Marinimicrobia bacterium]|nr:Chromosome partition protein Smc [Candidatus Neomarinimicrobiota bacterium]